MAHCPLACKDSLVSPLNFKEGTLLRVAPVSRNATLCKKTRLLTHWKKGLRLLRLYTSLVARDHGDQNLTYSKINFCFYANLRGRAVCRIITTNLVLPSDQLFADFNEYNSRLVNLTDK
jgi:hypothetical protein